MGIRTIDFDIRYLDELIAMWNECLIHDPVNKDIFLNRITFDPNFDGALSRLAIDDEGILVGFCHAIRRKESYYTKGFERDRAWINFIFIKRSHRRKGIATKLVKEIEDKVKEAGAKSVTLSAYSPNYLNPGIDIRYKEALLFFESMGYVLSESESVSMQRSLWDFELLPDHLESIKQLKNKGIVVRQYKLSDYNIVLDFLNKEFEHGWVRNFIIASQENRAEQTIVICIDSENNVLGYCMRAIDGNPNRFGPIGVAKSERSSGLGSVLINEMFYEMKKAGLMYTNFLWTSGNAIRFYERHGMKIYRSYKTSRKEI